MTFAMSLILILTFLLNIIENRQRSRVINSSMGVGKLSLNEQKKDMLDYLKRLGTLDCG